MVGQWIALDAQKLNPLRERQELGAHAYTQLSPYDVPTHVRASRDEASITVEFRYLDDEPKVTRVRKDNIRLRIGRVSGRLYEIIIPWSILREARQGIGVESVADTTINAVKAEPKPLRTHWWALTDPYLSTLVAAVHRGIPSTVLR